MSANDVRTTTEETAIESNNNLNGEQKLRDGSEQTPNTMRAINDQLTVFDRELSSHASIVAIKDMQYKDDLDAIEKDYELRDAQRKTLEGRSNTRGR